MGSPKLISKCLCLEDFEPLAKRRLPKPLFEYVRSGVETELSAAWNRASFAALGFVTRIARDVTTRSQTCVIFNEKYSMPVGIAPMGLLALNAYMGDSVVAAAAHREAIPMVVSGAALERLESVIQANPNAWFQAYLGRDLDSNLALLDRAAAAGYKTLVITVDVPVGGNRENNIRAGFKTPLRPSVRLVLQGLSRPKWLLTVFFRTVLKRGIPRFENASSKGGPYVISKNAVRDLSERGRLDWRQIAHLRDTWKGNLVLKGVLSSEDAKLARATGCSGIIVSNHGGRQLDGSVPPLVVLQEIVESCPGLVVMIDGGIRRGADVIKALALGARCVFVGRPFFYAAVVGGAAGVLRAIQLLRAEIDRNMAMLGLINLSEITGECVRDVSAVSVLRHSPSQG